MAGGAAASFRRSTGRFDHGERARAEGRFGDAEVHRGAGGETHQVAGGDVPVLTTQQGAPVSDDQNSLKVGPRGPALLEDLIFREKIFHFDHERIPERVVHARGFGAHGFFETYESLSDITAPTSSSEPARRRRCSCASRRWRATRARPILPATCAALP